MATKKEIVSKIEEIKRVTNIKVNSYKTITRGGESLIIEINGKWIFRFPRNSISKENTKERLDFLISFAKISPLKIPIPKYIEDGFVGYEKIQGSHPRPTNIKNLTERDRLKIAKQIGLFLKGLHNFKSKKINFDTGYLVMRKDDYITCPKEISKYLNTDEIKNLEVKLKAIANNPLNFKKPTSIIHGDFYFNNIIWNPDKKVITGVIDWANLGLGTPAMDFIMLADFNKNKNDKFLKNILKYYGAKGDDLFFQIKENAIIDTMNWFWSYYKENNSKGVVKMIKKLKNILA